MRNYSPHANGYLSMRNYSPRPVFPVDRQTDGQTEKRQTIAVTLDPPTRGLITIILK